MNETLFEKNIDQAIENVLKAYELVLESMKPSIHGYEEYGKQYQEDLHAVAKKLNEVIKLLL